MPSTSAEMPPTLGFFAVIEHELHGLFGGYLVLNAAGRPLEFHCSAPVKPNRAQEILYGPTLEPYLYGDQIGSTLVKASKQPPSLILVEQPAALAVRAHVDFPTALVIGQSSPSHTTTDSPTKQNTSGELLLGPNRLLVPPRYAADRDRITRSLSASDDWFDFGEPFQRIRTAIEEAQRATSKAA
jgi:hypothetical protein